MAVSEPDDDRGGLGNRVKQGLRLTLSAGILYVLFSQLDWQKASALIAQLNPFWLLPLILLMVIDRVWMAWKWRLLLRVLGPTPSLYDCIRVYYVSSFQGLALPLGGLGPDIVRYAHLRSSSISRHAVAISIVVERILGIIATGLLAVLGGAILLYMVRGGEWSAMWVLFVGCSVAGLLVAAGLLFSSNLQRRIYRFLNEKPWFSESTIFSRFASALRKYRDANRVLFTNFVLALVEQLFTVLIFFLGSIAFNVPVSFLACLAVLPISELLERLPISYAGLGVREGALVFFFGLLGIDYSSALVVSTSIFAIFLVTLLPGLIWSIQTKKYAIPDES